MEIIDAQVHMPAAWLPDWDLHGEEGLKLGTEVLLASMDAAGVDRGVISWDIEWSEFVATRFPDRFAVTPGPDPRDPEQLRQFDEGDFEDKFADLMARPGVVGYRLFLNYPEENVEKFKAGGFDRAFETCQRLEVPLMVMVSGAPAMAASVATAYPDLSLIIDHLGISQPPETDSPPWKMLPHVLELAQYENVTVKLTGAPTLSAEPYPFEDLWPHLSQMLEAFGPERLMWGADIHRVSGRISPMAWEVNYGGVHSYAEAVGFLRDTDQLSQSEKELIFAGTLRRVLGWPTGA